MTQPRSAKTFASYDCNSATALLRKRSNPAVMRGIGEAVAQQSVARQINWQPPE